MRVLLFGATGMVGNGVLRECLAASDVSAVITPVRSKLGVQSPKLREVWRGDFFDWVDAGDLLTGVDACFFCLGISAIGPSEAEYRRITYDLTLAVGQALARASPLAAFVYVTGAGTNAGGRSLWARVKGETENALLELPFRAVYCFRPGYIQPLHGVRSKVSWYNGIHRSLSWIYPLLRRLGPALATSTEAVGKAMLQVAAKPWPERVLGNAEINRAAELWDAEKNR